jgi:LacI family transcriptional regulator
VKIDTEPAIGDGHPRFPISLEIDFMSRLARSSAPARRPDRGVANMQAPRLPARGASLAEPAMPSKEKSLAEPATLRDVARLAGVSAATVSRILNGTARVTEDKRSAVERAIERLQFRPNFAAQSLRSGHTRTIGVLTQELESPYFTRGARGIEDGLLGSEYAPIVVPGHWNSIEELDRARLLIARRVDAMVILGGNLQDDQVSEMARKLPIAITGRDLDAPNVFSLHCDQVEGACRAVRHLIELGHTRIAHITGPVSYPDAIDRREGYMRAHSEAGLPVDPRLLRVGTYLETGGAEAMTQLLEAGHEFTAVFCANDQTLWGARQVLYERGIGVPEDISLVGFDDLPQSAYMTPAVTTVHQPIYEMGRAAAHKLLAALGASAPRGEPTPELRLVVRGTTRAL